MLLHCKLPNSMFMPLVTWRERIILFFSRPIPVICRRWLRQRCRSSRICNRQIKRIFSHHHRPDHRLMPSIQSHLVLTRKRPMMHLSYSVRKSRLKTKTLNRLIATLFSSLFFFKSKPIKQESDVFTKHVVLQNDNSLSEIANMFIVATLDDTVSIAPHLFNEQLSTIVAEELDRKLANTIFQELGLCICLFDILSMGDCIILPSDSNFHIKVKFRYVVFRPNIDEILVGKNKKNLSTLI